MDLVDSRRAGYTHSSVLLLELNQNPTVPAIYTKSGERSWFDMLEIAEEKTEKGARLGREGYVETSHCADEENPLKAGSQTLFVNTTTHGVTEDYSLHLPWLVDLQIPESF
ncbi:hypothetical protein F5Y11DRAFT_345759 [Daldinia sp. FL1419]|nr:hypothetical protein F5Y11DRAFT_345759 [Daldinia sp. FL1419]